MFYRTVVVSLIAIGISGCGPSQEEIKIADDCTNTEEALEQLGAKWETGVKQLITLKRKMDADEKVGDMVAYRQKNSEYFSLMTEIREDYMQPYGSLRENYPDTCKNNERREEFKKSFLDPFGEKSSSLLDKLRS